MPIKEVIKNDKKIYQYEAPADEILYERISDVADLLEKFVSKYDDLELEDLTLDKVLIGEALVRVDKRRDYFVIYHDDTKINELKETALRIYWFLKFKPIKVVNQEKVAKCRHINEAFSVFMLYSILRQETEKAGLKFSVSKEYNKRIMYGFKYWDISKCAMMLIVESLCASMEFESE